MSRVSTEMPCGFDKDLVVDFDTVNSISDWNPSDFDTEAFGIGGTLDTTADKEHSGLKFPLYDLPCNRTDMMEGEDCRGMKRKLDDLIDTGLVVGSVANITKAAEMDTCGESSDDSDQGENNNNNNDDVLGFSTTRSAWLPPRRMTMLGGNSKYRLKEERKKVLKISINKLRKIEDHESFLRRAVLINNTKKRLQAEIRADKLASSYRQNGQYYNSQQQPCFCESPPPAKKRAPSSRYGDSECGDVLTELYIPPTPNPPPHTEDESERSADVKWCRTDTPPPPPPPPPPPTSCMFQSESGAFLTRLQQNFSTPGTDKQYSCGHSSIFGEFQSVVFHSLIASLES